MNLLIFGGTNRLTFQLVKQGLGEGHYVTVFMPPSEGLTLRRHHCLHIIHGDVLHYDAVEEAMQGQEAVIDAIDLKTALCADYFSASVTNIVKAMQTNKVFRIIMVSKVGVKASFAQAPMLYRLLMRLIHNHTNQTMANIATHENLLMESGLNWTLVRTVIVSDKKAVSELAMSNDSNRKLKKSFVAAATLAHFLLSATAGQIHLSEVISVSDK